MRYIGGAELRGASGALSSGPYRSSRELSLTGLVGSDIWRPPTFVGNPGSTLRRPSRLRACFNLHHLPVHLLPVENTKAAIRRDALARRSAIAAGVSMKAAQAIAARPLPFAVPAGTRVSGFMPLKHE